MTEPNRALGEPDLALAAEASVRRRATRGRRLPIDALSSQRRGHSTRNVDGQPDGSVDPLLRAPEPRGDARRLRRQLNHTRNSLRPSLDPLRSRPDEDGPSPSLNIDRPAPYGYTARFAPAYRLGREGLDDSPADSSAPRHGHVPAAAGPHGRLTTSSAEVAEARSRTPPTLGDRTTLAPHYVGQPLPSMSRLTRGIRALQDRSTAIDGLGDRDRSLSPDDNWETLLTTITPDLQLPSADSSFTSATASASASTRPSRQISASTSITAPEDDANDDDKDEEHGHSDDSLDCDLSMSDVDDESFIDTEPDDYDDDDDDDDDDSDGSGTEVEDPPHMLALAASLAPYTYPLTARPALAPAWWQAAVQTHNQPQQQQHQPQAQPPQQPRPVQLQMGSSTPVTITETEIHLLMQLERTGQVPGWNPDGAPSYTLPESAANLACFLGLDGIQHMLHSLALWRGMSDEALAAVGLRRIVPLNQTL